MTQSNPLPPVSDKLLNKGIRESDCVICRYDERAHPKQCTGKLYMVDFECNSCKGKFTVCWHRPNLHWTVCPLCNQLAKSFHAEEVVE